MSLAVNLESQEKADEALVNYQKVVASYPSSFSAPSALMAQAQQLMSQPPLSPTETLATIDELGELGFLPPAMRAELKECMVVLPQTAAALGMGMSMLKPMLPQLREARTEMQALSPSEQDELAAAMASELKSISGDDRKLFLEQLGSGFFPPRVAEGVRQRLGAK